MKTAISLYQYYAGKRGTQVLIDVDDVSTNSDCGRLNLMCPVCCDRVRLVHRIKRQKVERYFAHWPNSDNQDCEQKFINTAQQQQRERQIIVAINKEKADYERYFWLIINQTFPLIQRLENAQEIVLKHKHSNQAFDEVFYPVFKECKKLIQFVCNGVLDNSVTKNWEGYDTLAKHDKRIVERILKQNSRLYRSKACLLLAEFLLQKKSQFIVKRLWAISIVLWKIENGIDSIIPSPSKFIPVVINNIMAFLIWVPWESALNDIKTLGKIQKRNRYSDNFDLITVNNLPDMPDEVNQIYKTRNSSKLGKTSGFDWS